MSKDHNIEANDPNGCLYLEAVPGDGGKHTAAQWWLSQDIRFDPSQTSAWPNPGTNFTQVQVHWNASCSGLTFPEGGDFAFPVFDLFIGDPWVATGMRPGVNIHTISSGLQSNTPSGGVSPMSMPPSVYTSSDSWTTASAGTTTTHFCMAARCYPFGVSPCNGSDPCGGDPPAGINAFMVDDPHYAQLNLAQVPAGQGPGMKIRFAINTGNFAEDAELITLRAQPDLNPERHVLDVILPGLRTMPGFKKIATTPLQNVGLDLSHFGKKYRGIWQHIAELADLVEDEIEEFFTHESDTSAEEKVQIRRDFYGPFYLTADATRATPGDAHVYHVTQADATGKVVGGITVVVVRV